MATHSTNLDHDIAHPRDVKAGPGDAGAADSPSHPTVPPRNSRSMSAWTVFWVLIAIGVIAYLGMYLFT